MARIGAAHRLLPLQIGAARGRAGSPAIAMMMMFWSAHAPTSGTAHVGSRAVPHVARLFR
jgi:hypothetical protein